MILSISRVVSGAHGVFIQHRRLAAVVPTAVAVLYVGPGDEALDLADALDDTLAGTATIVPAPPTTDPVSLLSDDRIDCLVYADGERDELLDTVRDWQPDVPVVGYGTGHGKATVTVEQGADVGALATAIADVVSGDGDDETRQSQSTTVYRRTDTYYAVDGQWRITDWDPSMEGRTGKAPEDVIGNVLWDEFPEAMETVAYEQYSEVMESGEPATFELYYEPGDYWVKVRAYPRDDGGIEFYTRDISERKEYEREIEAANQRLEETLERIDDAFFAVDDDWTITRFNGRAEAILDRDAESVLGTNLWEAFPEVVDTQFYEEYHEAMETQESTTFEAYFEPTATWFEVRAYPSEEGLSVYFRDVTDRKDREEELRRRGRAIEKAPVGITISDPGQADNPLVYVNEAFEQLTGYDGNDIVGRNCRFLQGPDTRESAVGRIREGIDAGEPVGVELLNYRADGTTFWNRVNIAPIRDDDGTIVNFVGFQRDVTSRREMEERLRELHQTSRDLMIAQDERGIADLAVEAAADILGLTETGIWRYSEVEDVLVPVDRARADDESIVPELPTFGHDSLAWKVYQDGDVRVFEDVSQHEGVHNPDTSARSEIIAPLGGYGVMITGSTTADAFSDRDVELFRVLATTTEAALARAERESQLQRQNERLDEFVSVVSHDLRNPLQVARIRLESYRETGDPEHLDPVERNVERMRLLIEDLLDLARQGETVDEPEQVTLPAITARAWDAVDAPDATLEAALSSTLLADPRRLQQLFENVFRNAVGHAGPAVTVEVGLLDGGEGFYVADDGPGISEADREQVFDHGFSTADEGTGFGLSIVKRIAEAHGWDVAITESAEGGARFEFTGITSLTSTG